MTFSGVFGHFGGILGVFWIGAFCGIASRWGPRGRRPPTPQYPPTIPISLLLVEHLLVLKDIERYGTSQNRSDMNRRKIDGLLAKINIVV